MSRKNINICGFNQNVKTSIKNICFNKGISFKDFMRPQISEIIKNTHPSLKIKQEKTSLKDIRLTDFLNETSSSELMTICENIGVTPSAYIKIKIVEKLIEFPDYIKKEM